MKQFQYGIGAEFLFRFETRPLQENGKRERRYRYVKYKIESCRLHDGRVEYYNVNMIEEGKPDLAAELSASRLHYLINFNLEELISAGKRKIYPLTAEEVSEFYKERNAARYYENKRALNMLESSKQYQAVIQQIKQTEIKAARAEAECEFSKATDLNRKIELYKDELKKIREELGISSDVLLMKYECEKCRDRGVLPDGKICECARKHEKEIRAYVAQEVGA